MGFDGKRLSSSVRNASRVDVPDLCILLDSVMFPAVKIPVMSSFSVEAFAL